MDELEQTLLRLRGSVERRVHVKLARALPPQALQGTSYQTGGALMGEATPPHRDPTPPPPANHSFWTRLTDFAARRFHR